MDLVRCLSEHGVYVAGLVNEKTVHVEASEEGGISITRTLPKHANKPRNYKSKTNKKGKNFRRTAVRLGKEVQSIRPDLKVKHTICMLRLQGNSEVLHAGDMRAVHSFEHVAKRRLRCMGGDPVRCADVEVCTCRQQRSPAQAPSTSPSGQQQQSLRDVKGCCLCNDTGGSPRSVCQLSWLEPPCRL